MFTLFKVFDLIDHPLGAPGDWVPAAPTACEPRVADDVGRPARVG